MSHTHSSLWIKPLHRFPVSLWQKAWRRTSSFLLSARFVLCVESSFCSRNILRPTINRLCFCLKMILTTSFPELSVLSWPWNKAAFTEFLLCLFARAAGKNYHQLGGLKGQKCILLQFRRSESKTKVLAEWFLWALEESILWGGVWIPGLGATALQSGLSSCRFPSACTFSSVSPLSFPTPHHLSYKDTCHGI